MDKYFYQFYDWAQFSDNVNMPCKAEDVTQKDHHVVLASGMYIDVFKERRENPMVKQMWIGFKIFLQTSTMISISLRSWVQ